jgi:hypothetical protein
MTDAWAQRDMKICVRQRDQLPTFAQDLVTQLAQPLNR